MIRLPSEASFIEASPILDPVNLSAAAASRLGVEIKDIYWRMGACDSLFVADAPDDETMTAFSLSASSLGNLHTQTMQAFNGDGMNAILSKIP